MKEILRELIDHLKQLTYVEVGQAHSIRYKASEAVRDPVLAKQINRIKFNTWFLDPVPKRKKAFERARNSLISLIEQKIRSK